MHLHRESTRLDRRIRFSQSASFLERRGLVHQDAAELAIIGQRPGHHQLAGLVHRLEMSEVVLLELGALGRPFRAPGPRPADAPFDRSDKNSSRSAPAPAMRVAATGTVLACRVSARPSWSRRRIAPHMSNLIVVRIRVASIAAVIALVLGATPRLWADVRPPEVMSAAEIQ